ncbi:hypothetical protein [Roseateles sp.]|uniref:hypothetical protein n=1 Tax=Roseateles sp. TaxID=1971397 RepID=UPI00387E21EB
MTTLQGLVRQGLVVSAVPSPAMPARDHPLLVSIPLNGPEVMRCGGSIKRRVWLPPLSNSVSSLLRSRRRHLPVVEAHAFQG